MLDWDAPLSEQPEIMKIMQGSNTQTTAGSVPRTAPRVSLEEIGDADLAPTGRDLYEKLVFRADRELNDGVVRLARDAPRAGRTNAQQIASEQLKELGIPGIKYFDGTSRAAGEGTRNYVVFDENIITITKRNGEPVTQAEREQVLPESPAPLAQSKGRSGNKRFRQSRAIFRFCRSGAWSVN
jgi:hypothetical protein